MVHLTVERNLAKWETVEALYLRKDQADVCGLLHLPSGFKSHKENRGKKHGRLIGYNLALGICLQEAVKLSSGLIANGIY